MTRTRPAVWLMAAVTMFLLAVAGYVLLVHASPQYYWEQIDTAVYRDGGIAARNQPTMLYALKLGPAKLPFIYTPFAALLFAAGSGASFATWQVGLAVLTIGLLPVVTYLSLGLAGRPAGRGNSRAAVEFTWRGLELVVGNYYVLTLLAFIAATACALVPAISLRSREVPDR